MNDRKPFQVLRTALAFKCRQCGGTECLGPGASDVHSGVESRDRYLQQLYEEPPSPVWHRCTPKTVGLADFVGVDFVEDEAGE